MKKALNLFSFIICLIFLIVLMIFPEPAKEGTINGLLICGRIIIPSLFAFCAVLGFIIKCDFIKKLKVNKALIIFIFSLFGGYPMGAKMLSLSVENGDISKENAPKMLPFLINCGPSFAISVIGLGFLNSKALGIILYFSNCLSSFLFYLFSRKNLRISPQNKPINPRNEIPIDNFVNSCFDAANTCIKVSIFIVIFSVINSYLGLISKRFSFMKILILLNEVTFSARSANNIYFLSFILSFAGFCIWLQIFSLCSNFKIDYLKFALFRILHGIISVAFTKLFITIFKIPLKTISNLQVAYLSPTEKSAMFSLCLVVCAIVFIISLYSKLYVCKLSDNVI